MVLKAVTPDHQAQAMADLREKMRLEAIFTPVVVAFLSDINTDFERFFRREGRVLDVDAYRDRLQVLLALDYSRTADAFEGRIQLPPLEDEDLARIAALRDEALDPLLAARPAPQADIILGTVDSDLTRAVQIASRDAELTIAETATVAAGRYAEQIPGVADGIAVTETQAVAEMTKLAEARAAGVVLLQTPNKTWVHVNDDNVRDHHFAAGGQVRRLNEPFDVGGEQLMVPGDTSLGASASNIVNCRCDAVHGFSL